VPGLERWLAGRPAVLVANPTAQSGRAADWIRHARAHLDEVEVPHRFIATEPAGGTVELVRRAIDDDGARVVIYMGGDGTFAEVAKGIFASAHAADVAMGMLPTGTANDQGKSFGLEAGPGAVDRNVRVIAAGATIRVDVGALTVYRGADAPGGAGPVERDLFFDSFSVGFGAAALITRNRDRELVGRIPGLGLLYRNNLVYAGAVLQRLLESYVVDVKFDLTAEIDGVPHRFDSLLDVIVKNTQIFGGEWVLDPDTESDDGKFELVPVTGRRDFGAKLIASFRHNPFGADDLRAAGLEVAEPIAGSRFVLSVRTDDGTPPPAQIDGEELAPGDRYDILVAARALRLIVPREHVE
jgi:diacylglycerol kinase family enzyme